MACWAKVKVEFLSGRRQNYRQFSFIHCSNGNFGREYLQLGKGQISFLGVRIGQVAQCNVSDTCGIVVYPAEWLGLSAVGNWVLRMKLASPISAVRGSDALFPNDFGEVLSDYSMHVVCSCVLQNYQQWAQLTAKLNNSLASALSHRIMPKTVSTRAPAIAERPTRHFMSVMLKC